MEKKQNLNIQAAIYSITPDILKSPLNSFRILPHYISWYFSNNGRKHAQEILKGLKGNFVGHRCIVIGNGPSLNQMDLSLLKNEYTFGLNRIYLLFDKLSFETDYLVVSNGLVMSQFANEIMNTKSFKLLNWKHRDGYEVDDNTVFVNAKPIRSLNGEITNGYYLGGGTVTNVALEFAYFLGFSEVILIGVDHNYSTKGQPGKAITSKADDRDHFSPAYFGKGITWQLPNYINMENGFRKNRELFGEDDRKIVDATRNGKLQVFPKVNFEEYLLSSNYKNKKV